MKDHRSNVLISHQHSKSKNQIFHNFQSPSVRLLHNKRFLDVGTSYWTEVADESNKANELKDSLAVFNFIYLYSSVERGAVEVNYFPQKNDAGQRSNPDLSGSWSEFDTQQFSQVPPRFTTVNESFTHLESKVFLAIS